MKEVLGWIDPEDASFEQLKDSISLYQPPDHSLANVFLASSGTHAIGSWQVVKRWFEKLSDTGYFDAFHELRTTYPHTRQLINESAIELYHSKVSTSSVIFFDKIFDNCSLHSFLVAYKVLGGNSNRNIQFLAHRKPDLPAVMLDPCCDVAVIIAPIGDDHEAPIPESVYKDSIKFNKQFFIQNKDIFTL